MDFELTEEQKEFKALARGILEKELKPLVLRLDEKSVYHAGFIKEILEKGHRGNGKVIFEADPKILVEKIIELIRKEKVIEI